MLLGEYDWWDFRASPLANVLIFLLIAARGCGSRPVPHAWPRRHSRKSQTSKIFPSHHITVPLLCRRTTCWWTVMVQLVLRDLDPPSSPPKITVPGLRWMQNYCLTDLLRNWCVPIPQNPEHKQPRRAISTPLGCSLGR